MRLHFVFFSHSFGVREWWGAGSGIDLFSWLSFDLNTAIDHPSRALLCLHLFNQ